MKSLSLSGDAVTLKETLEAALRIDPSLLILFASPKMLKDTACSAMIKDQLQGRPYIGCSTAGEISNNGVGKDSLALMSLRFDTTEVRTATAPMRDMALCFEAGKEIGRQLKDEKLKLIYVFCPGARVNGSAVIDGIVSSVNHGVIIAGGLAGDEVNFKQTFTLCDGKQLEDHVVAAGFYGDDFIASCGSEGGWKPFGPARRVTKAENNTLQELDGKPALQLYKQYLGDKARLLPASGLSYPFAVLRDDRTTSGIIRSALDVDHEKEAIILAGDIKQGAKVCLMHADASALTQGAAQAAAEALRTHAGPEENGCALIVSCVGRRLVLGIDVDDEIEAVVDSFLPGTPIAGYYSYGEICSYKQTGRAELHNQTMTITYLTEKTGA